MYFIHRLNDEELTDIVLEGEEREMRQKLDSLPESLGAQANQPEWFWHQQHRGIRMRIRQAEHTWLRPAAAWGSAFALVTLSMVMLLPKKTASSPAAQAHTDPDQELLLAVEAAVHRDMPRALEPAAILAQEIHKHGATDARSHLIKENDHEDE